MSSVLVDQAGAGRVEEVGVNSPPNENLTRDIASSSNRRDRRPDPAAGELDALAGRPAPLRCSLTVVRAKSPGCAEAELGGVAGWG